MMYEKSKELLRRHTSLLPLLRTTRFRILQLWCWLVRSRVVDRYLRSHPVRKLQIGAGRNLLGDWLNTDLRPVRRDVVFLDATKPFPFEDATFDYVISEHQIEHVTYKRGLRMLRECLRVLKPGGKIRLATPDLEILVGLYAREKSDLQRRYIEWIVDTYLPEVGRYKAPFVVNNAFRNWGHQFIYDYETLQGAMEQAGFVNITRHALGESNDINLQAVESHDHVTNNPELTRFETMVLQGERPI